MDEAIAFNAQYQKVKIRSTFNGALRIFIMPPCQTGRLTLAFGLLVIWKVPPWVVVIVSALLGFGLSLL